MYERFPQPTLVYVPRNPTIKERAGQAGPDPRRAAAGIHEGTESEAIPRPEEPIVAILGVWDFSMN